MNKEVTSSKVGSIASDILNAKDFFEYARLNHSRDEDEAWKAIKSVAGSDLNQVENKGGKSKTARRGRNTSATTKKRKSGRSDKKT